jgi:hypothetical protein
VRILEFGVSVAIFLSATDDPQRFQTRSMRASAIIPSGFLDQKESATLVFALVCSFSIMQTTVQKISSLEFP